MEFKRRLLKNIYFDAPGEGGGAGEVTPPAPQGGEIEVPSYINDYVNGMEEGEQKTYLSEIMKDQRGVDTLKTFIKDPNQAWDIDTKEYKEKIQGVDEFIEEMKSSGYSQDTAKKLIEKRIEYLDSQKALMTAEEIQAGENITNFINSEKNDEFKLVYERMAENASGRRVLLELMKLKGGNPTPGATGNPQNSKTIYNHDTFLDAYNDAYDAKDNVKLRELANFARNVKEQDSFYSDFLMLP